jgi:hypothetical protein
MVETKSQKKQREMENTKQGYDYFNQKEIGILVPLPWDNRISKTYHLILLIGISLETKMEELL